MCRQYANGTVGNESEGGHSMARRVHRFNQNAAQHFFIRSCKESPSPLLGLVAGRGGMDGNGVTSATGASKKRMLGTTVSHLVLPKIQTSLWRLLLLLHVLNMLLSEKFKENIVDLARAKMQSCHNACIACPLV